MPNPAGWSTRTTCYGCGAPTDHTFRCEPCRANYQAYRVRRRREWGEEGRCVTCSRIVLEENPRTGDLYKNCKVCRRRNSLKAMGKTVEEANAILAKIGGKPRRPNAAPPKDS